MTLPFLFGSAFIIGLSGAMMPGPLLTYVINGSLQRGFLAGPIIVLGHALLELFLIVLIFLGLDSLFASELFTALIGLAGGGVLFWMGYGMVRSAVKKEISLEVKAERGGRVRGLILPGAVVSLSNPYWILWWATIGMTYLAKSYQHGLIAGGVFYLGHISSDLIWYSFISWLAAAGKRVLSDHLYRCLVISFGTILIYFALTFIYRGMAYFL